MVVATKRKKGINRHVCTFQPVVKIRSLMNPEEKPTIYNICTADSTCQKVRTSDGTECGLRFSQLVNNWLDCEQKHGSKCEILPAARTLIKNRPDGRTISVEGIFFAVKKEFEANQSRR